MAGKRKRRLTAEEAMAELERDPEFRHRRAKQDAEFAAAWRALDEESLPVLRALRRIGVDVDSIEELDNTLDNYEAAVPLLLRHVKRAYSEATRACIARALAYPEARSGWKGLMKAYLAEGDDESEVKWALACALGAAADESVRQEVVDLIRDPAQGSSRLGFADVVVRLRGADSREVLEELGSDGRLADEAKKLLRKLKR